MSVHLLLLDHRDPDGAVSALLDHYRQYHLAAVQDWGRQAMDDLVGHGGFSMHDHIGDAPTIGYMVSLDKADEQVEDLQDITPSDIQEYRDEHASALAHPDVYLGAWENDGKVYLDVSAHFDDLSKAMKAASSNDQLAVYDLGTGRSLMTSDYTKAARRLVLVADPAVPSQQFVDQLKAMQQGNVYQRRALRLVRDDDYR